MSSEYRRKVEASQVPCARCSKTIRTANAVEIMADFFCPECVEPLWAEINEYDTWRGVGDYTILPCCNCVRQLILIEDVSNHPLCFTCKRPLCLPCYLSKAAPHFFHDNSYNCADCCKKEEKHYERWHGSDDHPLFRY